VDALIILSLNLKNESLELLRAARFPVCFVENEVDGFDCVAVQNLQGGHKAAMHLFNAGVKRPGFVGEKSALSYSIAATDDRLRGKKKVPPPTVPQEIPRPKKRREKSGTFEIPPMRGIPGDVQVSADMEVLHEQELRAQWEEARRETERQRRPLQRRRRGRLHPGLVPAGGAR